MSPDSRDLSHPSTGGRMEQGQTTPSRTYCAYPPLRREAFHRRRWALVSPLLQAERQRLFLQRRVRLAIGRATSQPVYHPGRTQRLIARPRTLRLAVAHPQDFPRKYRGKTSFALPRPKTSSPARSFALMGDVSKAPLFGKGRSGGVFPISPPRGFFYSGMTQVRRRLFAGRRLARPIGSCEKADSE